MINTELSSIETERFDLLSLAPSRQYAFWTYLYFPFDEQICHIELDSWSLPTAQAQFANDSFSASDQLTREWYLEHH